ncbi:MAG TPA: hypothetical protein DDW52_27500 [Planctomycetaceae bacterium]|nr:hypothetical protein [Planctomycetaceae bacterium]
MHRVLLLVILLFSVSGRAVCAEEFNGKALFNQLKEFEGQWRIAEPARSVVVQFEVIANGSVITEMWRMPGERSSLTIYSMDGNRLLVTHYCPQRNVPRLVCAGQDKYGVYRFEFLDGTNLQDRKASHMHAAWLQIMSKDSFIRNETYIENGSKFVADEHNDAPMTYVRVK